MEIIRREKLTGKKLGTNYIKLPPPALELPYTNFKAYPCIDPQTNELEWFIDKNSDTYKSIINIINNGVI